MPLTNSQYDAIIRTYEEKQNKNRHALEERRAYVYSHVDGFRELEDSIASISVAQGRKLLEGDESALHELRLLLRNLSESKTSLLRLPAFPQTILSLSTTARTVWIPDILTAGNAIVSARQKFPCFMNNPTSAVLWKRKIFPPFLMNIIRETI